MKYGIDANWKNERKNFFFFGGLLNDEILFVSEQLNLFMFN